MKRIKNRRKHFRISNPLGFSLFCPIGTDTSFDTDGGIWIDQHEGYMLLPNFTCTYRGGVHLNSSRGKLGIRAERNLGAVPESPTNNIFFLKSGAAFVSHGSNGNICLDPNRNLYLADGVVARLQTWSGSDQSMTIQGTIGCENVSNGVVDEGLVDGVVLPAGDGLHDEQADFVTGVEESWILGVVAEADEIVPRATDEVRVAPVCVGREGVADERKL